MKLQRATLITQLLAILLTAVLAGCASYHPATVSDQVFLQRAVVKSQDGVTVRMAVPDAEETEHLTGLDLYNQGIQPLWLEVKNQSGEYLRASLWSLDRDYFSPIEVAYMNRHRFSSSGYEHMQDWFHENQFHRRINNNSSVKGLVYTNYQPGTRGFNLDLMGSENAYSFTLFVPMPGFTPDHANVNFATLYPESAITHLDEAALIKALEQEVPCCAISQNTQVPSAPFNVVLVGSAETLRQSLLRGRWQETSERRNEAGIGTKQYYDGRPPDTIFTRPRHDGNEKLVLNLWLTHWRTEAQPVWLGQAYYWSDSLAELAAQAGQRVFRDTELFEWFARESIAADLDAAARFVAQNFWYNQSAAAMGMTAPVKSVALSSPAIGHGGSAYFTDGRRTVIYLSSEPIGLDEAVINFYPDPEQASQ